MGMFSESPIAAFIDQQGLMILDGGLATELERRGHDLDHSLWSARLLDLEPGAIMAVHLAYLNAGADCLVTSSYQATVQGFVEHGMSAAKATALLDRSVDLANQARERFLDDKKPDENGRLEPLVAASVGPYGAYLADGSEYSGRYGLSRQQLREFHEPRWEVLDHSRADFLACETIPSLLEAEAILELLNQGSSKGAWMSFTCADENTLCDGTPVEECAALLAEQERVLAVGVNCLAPSLVQSIVSRFQQLLSDKPIVVYPNSGETFQPNERIWTGCADSADFSEAALIWKKAGASIIGGCCRTGPEHIKQMREVLLS
jgi:homocysteine S-methyltransferase